jgi:TP53 regulating kinase-like protein
MMHEGKLHLIDFGLSYVKNGVEDKAVDLYVFEKALNSMHPGLEEVWKDF